MDKKDGVLKELIHESVYRLKKEIMTCDLKLYLVPDTHVPDTLTRIRILPSVAVVGQVDKVIRATTGHDSVIIYVKFLPQLSATYPSVMRIARMIKKLPGIEIVRVERIGGRKVLYKDEPIVI